MLNSMDPNMHDFIALQEPWLDSLGRMRANHHWEVVYPVQHADQPAKTQAVILVSRAISTNCWTLIDTGTQDIAAIWFEHYGGSVNFFNVYNDCDHSQALEALENTLCHLSNSPEAAMQDCDCHMIWLRDFNWHHPIWDDAGNSHLFTRANLDKAQTLLNLMASYDMTMALPPTIPTLEAKATKNYTRADNVFVTTELEEAVQFCSTLPDQCLVCTDHLPILTVLDLQVTCNNAIT